MGILLDRLRDMAGDCDGPLIFRHVDKTASVNSVLKMVNSPTIYALIEYFDCTTGEYLGSRVDECPMYGTYIDTKYSQQLIQDMFDLDTDIHGYSCNFDPHSWSGLSVWQPYQSPLQPRLTHVAYTLRSHNSDSAPYRWGYCGFKNDWDHVRTATLSITEVVVGNEE